MPLNATGITGELDKRRSFKHGDCPRQGLKGKDVDRDGYRLGPRGPTMLQHQVSP